LKKLEEEYEIIEQEIEEFTTDSGKTLKLQGHIIKFEQGKANTLL